MLLNVSNNGFLSRFLTFDCNLFLLALGPMRLPHGMANGPTSRRTMLSQSSRLISGFSLLFTRTEVPRKMSSLGLDEVGFAFGLVELKHANGDRLLVVFGLTGGDVPKSSGVTCLGPEASKAATPEFSTFFIRLTRSDSLSRLLLLGLFVVVRAS